MTQKAASQSKMNTLHDRVASVFLRVLQEYDRLLDAQEARLAKPEEISDEVLAQLLSEGFMPSPAMMSAITKFLKDNEVLFEKEKIEEVSAQQKALEERRKNRPALGDIIDFPSRNGTE